MNLVLLFSHEINSNNIAVISDERRLKHILSVHNIAVGDTLKAGILNGNMGRARVLAVSEQQIELDCGELSEAPPKALPVTVILGLPRPKMLKRILQTIATLGVKKLYLIHSYRVEKSYWQTPFLKDEAIREQLLLGLEQGCDTLLPEVHLIKRFKPFVEDELPSIALNTQALVAHPYTAIDCPREQTGPITLAIGPEGGFIPYEIDLLTKTGFQAVTLGPRILKVETAVPYLLSRLF